jgi:hypothetical protein
MRWQHWSPPDRELGSGAVGHVALQSPPLQGGRIWSCKIHGAPEPSLLGGRIQSCRTHGTPEPWYTCGAGARLIGKAGSGATGHVVAPDPTLAGRQAPVP